MIFDSRGERGVQGERGERGDHGQHGDNGAPGTDGRQGVPGPEGQHGLTGRSGGYALFLLTCIFVTLVFWGEDKRSCARQVLPREGNRELAINARHARLADARRARHELGARNPVTLEYYRLANVYLDAANKNMPPDCSGLLPDAR